MALTKEKVISVLKEVDDPELHMDIWTMGLVYKVEIKEDKVHILMTLTSPMCPYGGALLEDVKASVKKVKGVKKVEVELTFDPPWKPGEGFREMMGL